jgi:N-acyl-D-amino-acid deacylase
MRGESVTDAIMNLVVEDRSRVGTVYFMMSEDNIRKQIKLPWVSFGSDAASMAPEPPFTRSSAHPRAYGNFARLLGQYVRDEKVIPLEEAVHRLSGLPATNLALPGRGFLREGMFADVVVFDPATIGDRATFETPHQYAVGMTHVFVNGVQVLENGEHTGARPGRGGLGRGRAQPGGDTDYTDNDSDVTNSCAPNISIGIRRGSATIWASRSSGTGVRRCSRFPPAMATSGSSNATA